MCCSVCVDWILSLVILTLLYGGSSGEENKEKGPEIIFSTRESLLMFELDKPEQTSAIVSGLKNAVAVDYHFEKKIVVWSDVKEDLKGIYSANIETGGDKEILARDQVITPDGLAVDWIHNNVYWTDTGLDTISVASLDGKMRKQLFGKDLDEPRAIVLSPLEGWMFWTDWGASAKIERSSMDGTRRSTIISTNISIPNGLTIDFDSKRLFWADVHYHTISSSDYDGSKVKTVLQSFARLGHPFAVDVFEDWLYWTDWRSHNVSKVHKASGTDLQSVTTGIHFFPMGLRVYHSSKQPKGKRYCGEKNAECLYLCLPIPTGIGRSANYTCACPDGVDCTTLSSTVAKEMEPVLSYSTIIGRNIYATSEFIPYSKSTAQTPSLPESPSATPSTSELKSHSVDEILHEINKSVYYCGQFSGIIFGTLVIIILGISLVGFYMYRQRLGKKSSLNFANPLFRKQQDDQIKLESGIDI